MKPFLIVDLLQELSDAGAGFCKITLFVSIDLFVFQRLQERLTGRIVLRVTFAAHADLGFVAFQHLRVLLRSVWHAAIRMMDESRLRLSFC